MTSDPIWRKAGAQAYAAGIAHGDNPHLRAIRRCVEAGEPVDDAVRLAELWWEGWEAASRNRSLQMIASGGALH